MLADPSAPLEPKHHADVAIVGAGPAGIVLALELARAGHNVVLIESGGKSRDDAIQHLGDTVGDDPLHVSMSLATSRQIGGASNLWGGRCVPFDPIDFERRDITGNAAWPVRYDELYPFFQRACDWCVCGDAIFDVRDLPELAGRALVPGFVAGRVRADSLERWSLPTNFARQYGSALRTAPNLTLHTGLTCTEIVCEQSCLRVDHLLAQSATGQRVAIRASKYIVACGGLESTRLLFASNKRHAEGLGNHSGHLGRWYMAHVESRVARVHFSTSPETTIYGHERDRDGVYVRRRITFSEEVLRDEQLPNAALWLVNPEVSDPRHGSAILSFVYLMLASPAGRLFVAEGIRQAHLKGANKSTAAHLRNILRDLPTAARFAVIFAYQRFLKSGRKVPGFFVPSSANVYPILYHGEHLPHKESRVEPSSERDRLGMPRLQTHLWFSDEDVDSVRRAHDELDSYLKERRLGRVEYLYEDVEQAVRDQLFGGYHQAGTTRMSDRPDDGVVDRNLAVHGFSDLFVASSSTFVTSGQANSTFMLIVFALRLASFVSEELAAATNDLPSSEHQRGSSKA
jgi:choline dehydrogenase-like flavoprotein